MSRFLILGVFYLLAYGSEMAVASQSQISDEEKASQLLFYLASDDVTMGRNQILSIIGRTDTAASSLYKRLYDKEMDRIRKDQKQKKSDVEEPRVFIFKAWDVREATLREFELLGLSAIPVLRRSIHSARQDLIMGVLKALRKLSAEDTLPILADVLERNPEGQTRFSSRVRQEAILGLRTQDPEEERWKKLVAENIVDLDPEARGLAQATAVLALKSSPDWSRAQLQRALDHELFLLEKYRQKALSWDNIKGFDNDPAKYSSVLQTLEIILENVPSIYPDPFPELLKSSDSVLRLSLLHHEKLSENVRSELLRLSMIHSSSVVVLDGLRALVESDRAEFSVAVLEKLKLQTDPAVLSESIRLSGQWNLGKGKSSLEVIAAKARRPGVKALAEETLKGL